jgi:hypothetical protein
LCQAILWKKKSLALTCGSLGWLAVASIMLKLLRKLTRLTIYINELINCLISVLGTCKLGSSCLAPPYSKCVSSSGAFACVCPRFCPMKYEPVCGSDGTIYGNLCTLKIAACKANQTITSTNVSQCGKQYNIVHYIHFRNVVFRNIYTNIQISNEMQNSKDCELDILMNTLFYFSLKPNLFKCTL